MVRYGDYIVLLSMTLNASACLAYLAQGYYWPSLYWAAAFTINLTVLKGLR